MKSLLFLPLAILAAVVRADDITIIVRLARAIVQLMGLRERF